MTPDLLNSLDPIVLMGGPGAERAVSINSGLAVVRALGSIGVTARAVEINDASIDHLPPTGLAFNLIHGTFGEDGQIQQLLESRGIPFTGEGSAESRLAFDKILTKKAFDTGGVPTCRWSVLSNPDDLPAPPYVLKSPRQGSSVGVHIVESASAGPAAFRDCLEYGDEVLCEEFFPGRELTAGVLGDRILPIVEIAPKQGHYDYHNKYTKGATDYFVPAQIGEEATHAVTEAARRAVQALRLRIYSRVDILLAPDGRLNVMEINTIPGMTETSLLPKSASAAGIPFGELCLEIARLSMERRRTT